MKQIRKQEKPISNISNIFEDTLLLLSTIFKQLQLISALKKMITIFICFKVFQENLCCSQKLLYN